MDLSSLSFDFLDLYRAPWILELGFPMNHELGLLLGLDVEPLWRAQAQLKAELGHGVFLEREKIGELSSALGYPWPVLSCCHHWIFSSSASPLCSTMGLQQPGLGLPPMLGETSSSTLGLSSARWQARPSAVAVAALLGQSGSLAWSRLAEKELLGRSYAQPPMAMLGLLALLWDGVLLSSTSAFLCSHPELSLSGFGRMGKRGHVLVLVMSSAASPCSTTRDARPWDGFGYEIGVAPISAMAGAWR
ncbi:hypothetical protein Dimus_035475 [Dionaea muscipula]